MWRAKCQVRRHGERVLRLVAARLISPSLKRGVLRRVLISFSDATFQKHLNAYLEGIGVPTQTYLELMAMVQQVCEQRFQAAQHLSNLEYWRTCNDPGVRIMTCMSRRRE